MIRSIFSRALDAFDLVFDALGALWRVVLRGAFSPDAKAYRGGHFAALASSDVLVQEIALNTADAGEAKKAVLLDTERFLPLALETVLFDVAGPLEHDQRPRPRPERAFALAVVRKDQLASARAALPLLRRRRIEAFVHKPSAAPDAAFVFADEAGNRRRRLRRALTAIALSVFVLSASEAFTAAAAALETQLAQAETERAAIDRRIRLAQRRLDAARTQQQAQTQARGVRLAEVSARLTRIGRHQHPVSELTSLSLDAHGIALQGRAYEPDSAELALRRAFEHETLVFASEEGEPPQRFSARLSFTQGPAP